MRFARGVVAGWGAHAWHRRGLLFPFFQFSASVGKGTEIRHFCKAGIGVYPAPVPENSFEGVKQVYVGALVLGPGRIFGFASGFRGHLVLVREVARHVVSIAMTALSVR